MTRIGKTALGIAAVIQPLVIVGALLGLLWLYHNNSPVDLGKVYSVSKAGGMTEVESLVGKPDHVMKWTEHGRESWTYRNPFSWYDFRVDFDTDGTLLGCVFQD